MAIARELKRLAFDVTVVESKEPGAGASNAAAGIIAAQLDARAPSPFFHLCLASHEMYPLWVSELCAESDMAVDFAETGALEVAFDDRQAEVAKATVKWQSGVQLPAAWLGPAELRALEPNVSSAALGAAYFADDAQLDPKKLVRALSIANARAGIHLQIGTARALLEIGGAIVGADIDGTELRADVVVVACGAWSPFVAGARLAPHQVRPARGQIVELQGQLPLLTALVKCEETYLMPRSGGRLVVGSNVEMVGYTEQVTPTFLASTLTDALRLVPAAASATLRDSWSGLRPRSPDDLPIIGPAPIPGLMYATGHFRHGILLSPITANLIGQVIQGRPTTLDLTPFNYQRFDGPELRAPKA